MRDVNYIKIPNPFKDGWIYKNEPYNKITAWVDLILNAEQEDNSFSLNRKLVTIKKGQVITSVRACAFRWGWSNDKVTRFFQLLEKDDMIHRDCSVGMTIITINNYEDVISLKDTEDIQITEENLEILSDNQDEVQEKNTNDKKEKKKTELQTKQFYDDPELNQAFIDFVEMRKKIKKPMTDRAVKLAKGKIAKYAAIPFSDEINKGQAIKILEQSILNSWQDVYPLKETKQNDSTGWEDA